MHTALLYTKYHCQAAHDGSIFFFLKTKIFQGSSQMPPNCHGRVIFSRILCVLHDEAEHSSLSDLIIPPTSIEIKLNI